MPPTLFREFLFSVAVGPLPLWVASPGSSESAPCVTWSVFGSPPLWYDPPLSGGRPQTQSPRREVVSGPAHTRGAHPTASGRLKGVALIEQTALLWQLGSSLFGLPARGPSRPLCQRSVLGSSPFFLADVIHSLFQTTVPADAVSQVSQHARYRLDRGVAHRLCLDHVADEEDASWRKTLHHMRSFGGAKPILQRGVQMESNVFEQVRGISSLDT